jgi:uncharacterized protein
MSNGNKYLIISCDGGGIRGVVTSLLLQDLGQSVLDRVDLYAGNSTGSIIAVALASGSQTIDQVAQLYLDPTTCTRIFSPYLPAEEQRRALHGMREAYRHIAPMEVEASLFGDLQEILPDLLFPMYSSDGLRHILVEHLRDMTLEQVWTEQGKRLLAPTFRLHGPPEVKPLWAPAAMHNLPNLSELGDYQQVTLVDAVMCSADPPILFQPHTLPSGDQFVDGALFANNPATLTLTALLKSGLIGGSGVGLGDVYMLSAGTGFNPASFPPSSPSFPYSLFPYGVLGWLWPRQTSTTPPLPLLSALADGSSQIDTFQASLLLGGANFRRGNVDFGNEIFSQTDCAGVPTMAELTERYIASDEWKEIRDWVGKNFT